jgi:colanic acid biosynthesis glycosyl transferase WcaI
VKLLVIAPHFAPDVAPTGEVITSIVDGLVDRGHSVHVITALPWYRGHRVEDGWGGKLVRTEATEWGAISRLHPFPTEIEHSSSPAFGGSLPCHAAKPAIRHRPSKSWLCHRAAAGLPRRW